MDDATRLEAIRRTLGKLAEDLEQHFDKCPQTETDPETSEAMRQTAVVLERLRTHARFDRLEDGPLVDLIDELDELTDDLSRMVEQHVEVCS